MSATSTSLVGTFKIDQLIQCKLLFVILSMHFMEDV